MSKSIIVVLIAVLVTAINVGLTRYMMNDQKQVILASLNAPQIAVIDHDSLIEQLKEGAEEAEHMHAQVLADRENVITALRLQNYIVLSSDYVIGHSPRYDLGKVDMPSIRQYLEDIGAPISTPDEHKQRLEQTGRELQRLLQLQID
jgi:hypothetical protein